MRWVGEFVGFPAAIGAFTSGGTISNVTALAAARERALPGSPRRRGSAAAAWPSTAPPRCTTRSRARWSCSGIGSANLRALPIDDGTADAARRAGRRDRARRRRTAITPDRGRGHRRHDAHGRDRSDRATSPRSAPSRGVWVHVDGAYGLPAAGAASVRARFDGLDGADSVSVDAHKWLYLPKACGVVLVRDGRDLAERVRARGGLPAAPAARAARGRHHPRVLAAVPGAEAVARVPRARRARSSARRSSATSSEAAPALRRGRRAATTSSPLGGRRSCRSCRSATGPTGVADLERAQPARSRRRCRPTAACTCRRP